MRCSVPGCKNDSRHISKSQGITFHTFPTDATHCAAWLKAINRSTWSPRDRSAVCSTHFLPQELYVTKNGLRKVRVGAVPFVVQDYPPYMDSTSDIRACRMCLATEQRLFSITCYNMGGAFERITGLTLLSDECLPQLLCLECAQRLLNADTFRSRSLRAHQLMLDLLSKQELITADTLKSIDRVSHFLTSPLQTIHNPPNVYTYEFTHTPTKLEENLNEESLVLEVDIKSEDQFNDKSDGIFIKSNEITIDKSNDLFIDKSSDLFVDKSNDYDDKSNEMFIDKTSDMLVDKNDELFIDRSNEIFVDETKEFSEGADDNDDNFVAEKEFESDDSLPLEVARKKKKKDKDETKKRKKEKTATKRGRRKVEKSPTEPKIDRRRKPFLNQDLNETLFTVTNLTFEEQIAEIEKRQESDNYKHSVFKCNECFKGFLDQDAYNGHMMRHTDECGEHKCEICKTHFKHSHALRKHITAHHTQRFSCNQCSYVTTHRQTARLHERWHKGTRYKCPHCPEDFVKFTTYMGHVRIKHPSDFVCALCGYSFVSAKGIELHKKLKHRHAETIPEDGPYCEACDVRFVSHEAHRKHLSVSARHAGQGARESNKAGRRVQPTREKQSKPEEDQEENEDRRAYPSQMRKAEGPISCEQCGLQVEDSRAYHGHFRRAHPDKNRTNYPAMKSPCMCELCGRIFQSYALLKDHTWTHTGERPFKCSECGKSFRMKQRLVAHRRVHALVKASYVCAVCGKHLSTHSNRQRHMFIHTGLKPYKCEMCGKGFKHASEKRAHVTYVHLKKPWPKRSRGKRPGRQGSEPPQDEAGMELAAWPPCDPKLPNIDILHDKPVYYNLKM